MPIKKSKGKKKEVETKKPKKSTKGKVDKKESKKGSKGSSLRDRAKDKIKESKKKGFTAMREAKNERGGGNFSKFQNFYVAKGDMKPVIFLTDDPVVVRTHSVQKNLPNGKVFYPEYQCTEDDDCVLCQEAKDGNKSVSKPTNMGAILVLDVEGYEKDNVEKPYIVRPMLVNPSLASVLEHRDLKEGLLYTAFEMSKLDRGHSLDVIRDEDDEIQRFEDEEEILDVIREENEDSAKMIQEALDQHGDFRTWLEEEIIPDFLDPSRAEFNQSSSSKDDGGDEDEGTKYSFKKNRKSKDKDKGKDKGKSKGSRLRNRLR
jgi:hypothetical protein